MPTQYLAAIAHPKTGGSVDDLMKWLQSRGFDASRMQSGAVLFSGNGTQFAQHFGISEDTAAQHGRIGSIAVPDELQTHVTSISIPPIPSTH